MLLIMWLFCVTTWEIVLIRAAVFSTVDIDVYTIQDTLGTEESVQIIEVSSFQGVLIRGVHVRCFALYAWFGPASRAASVAQLVSVGLEANVMDSNPT